MWFREDRFLRRFAGSKESHSKGPASCVSVGTRPGVKATKSAAVPAWSGGETPVGLALADTPAGGAVTVLLDGVTGAARRAAFSNVLCVRVPVPVCKCGCALSV